MNAWAPRLDVMLSPEVLFVDVANIGGLDRLATCERGRLNWLDPESETEHALVAVTSNFDPPRRGETSHVDVTRDVNGDRCSDLLMGRGHNEMRVHLGVPGPELFTRRHQKVAVDVSSDEYAWLVNLNKDGKQDILMHLY